MGGIHGILEEVSKFTRRNRLLFLVTGETWLRPATPLKHSVIVIGRRCPRKGLSKG